MHYLDESAWKALTYYYRTRGGMRALGEDVGTSRWTLYRHLADVRKGRQPANSTLIKKINTQAWILQLPKPFKELLWTSPF